MIELSTAISRFSKHEPEIALNEQQRRAALQVIKSRAVIAHYQPMVRLDDQTVEGLAAMMRLNHPTGMRNPVSIYAAFHHPVLASALTDAFVERLADDRDAWAAELSRSDGYLSLPITSVDVLSKPRVRKLAENILGMGLPAGRIQIEVPEEVFRPEARRRAMVGLQCFRELGFRLLINGCSPSYARQKDLQAASFDVAVLSRETLDSMYTGAARAQALCADVVGVIRAAGIIPLVRRIETPEQCSLARSLGCELGQGYLFGAPKLPQHLNTVDASSPKHSELALSAGPSNRQVGSAEHSSSEANMKFSPDGRQYADRE